ncbi:hypothetical protein BRC89_09705 [Halobacteriales archaeon QS_4_70_19]|nr:MAG: hypothetical protein BRC89_09705 [Halobacteriales archaeon QS_4_70_19]
MSTGGTPTTGAPSGLAVTTCGPERLVDRLPGGVAAATVEATRRADVLVVDRRTGELRTDRPGEAEIAGRTVLVVPERPGARPSVTCYSRAAPGSDPAVELIRQAVELDATTASHYSVASAVAVANEDVSPTEEGETPTEPTDSFGLPAPETEEAPAAEHASLSPSAAELAARRDAVDDATRRLLDDAPEEATALAFCGLAGVVEPLPDA